MKSRLDQIESRLSAFIEGSVHLLPGGNHQPELVRQLVDVMERTIVEDPQTGILMGPDLFTIFVNPMVLPQWESNQDVLFSLALVLEEAAQTSGIIFRQAVTLKVAPDSTLPSKGVRITAVTHSRPLTQTAVIALSSDVDSISGDPRPNNAFLIIHGNENIPLRQVVINIGRKLNNQVVVDDPRVSRNHCQLRAVRGKFVLFDLNSTGGTFVNGTRITQYTLKPGDVISLAGVPLIYGEDSPSTASPPASGDTPHTSPSFDNSQGNH